MITHSVHDRFGQPSKHDSCKNDHIQGGGYVEFLILPGHVLRLRTVCMYGNINSTLIHV